MAEIKSIADVEHKPVKIWYAFVYKGVSDIQELECEQVGNKFLFPTTANKNLPKFMSVDGLNKPDLNKLAKGMIQVFAINRAELNRALSAASDELVDMIKKRENEIDIGATFKNMAMKE